MPLDVHVYKGKKSPLSDPRFEGQKYATDPNATGTIGQGNFTNDQLRVLANYKNRASMRYKDLSAFFCSACWFVYGVECPSCHARSPKDHFRSTESADDDPIFEVRGGMDYDRKDGLTWVIATCRKCSFAFRVIVR
jgi:hypothetical protein